MAGKEIILYRVYYDYDGKLVMLASKAIEKRVNIYFNNSLGIGYKQVKNYNLQRLNIGRTPQEAIDLIIRQNQAMIKSYSKYIGECEKTIKQLDKMKKEWEDKTGYII